MTKIQASDFNLHREVEAEVMNLGKITLEGLQILRPLVNIDGRQKVSRAKDGIQALAVIVRPGVRLVEADFDPVVQVFTSMFSLSIYILICMDSC